MSYSGNIGSPQSGQRVIFIPQAVFEQIIVETKRIQSIVEEHFRSRTPNEEHLKIHQYVLETPPSELAMIPHEKALPPPVIAYFSELRPKWCLDSPMMLYQIWSLDMLTKMEELDSITKGRSKSKLKEIKQEFAGRVLACWVIVEQKNFKARLFGANHQEAAYVMQRLQLHLPGFDGIKASLTNLQSAACSEAEKEQYTRCLKVLDIGVQLWIHPYYRNYIQRYSLDKFPRPEPFLPMDSARQIHAFTKMVRLAWMSVNTKQWLSTVHSAGFEVEDPPVGDALNAESAQKYRHHIQQYLLNIYPFVCKIFTLNLRAFKGDLTWDECRGVLGMPHTDQPNPPLQHWLADAAASLNAVIKDLGDILRLFENLICKKYLPNFHTFEELFGRLQQNFVKRFGEKEPLSPPSIQLEDFKPYGLDHLIEKFSKDLEKIHREFEENIQRHLPSETYSRELSQLFAFSGSHIAFAPVFAEILWPYKNAVIFAATKVFSALDKARKILLARLSQNLTTVDPKHLEAKKAELLIVLRSLVLFQFKSYIELFVTLRDIHVVLLAPMGNPKAFEEGLHLLPAQLTRFIRLEECETLVTPHVQQGKQQIDIAFSELSLEEPEKLRDIVEEKEPLPNLPLLAAEESVESLQVLETLDQIEKFKVVKGAKTRTLLTTLHQLGVYLTRWDGGSHMILAHINTRKTFPLPNHEILSKGVSGKLEDWINQEVLQKKKQEFVSS